MQMLESFLGPQGARYAQFVLAALVLLILIIVVWWLIRKAMGDRLNMSDKPDRRGRPPRLGITESFSVDRQGRRLVMVRRDNVEHLVMIGGPNDVLIESNVVRGERSIVARPELRLSEADLMPQAMAVEPPSPALQPTKPAPPVRPTEVAAAAIPTASQLPVMPQPAAPMPKPVQPPPAPVPVVELPKVELAKVELAKVELAKVEVPRAVVADVPVLNVDPAAANPDLLKATGQSLAERIRSGLPAAPVATRVSESIRPPDPVKISEPPKDMPLKDLPPKDMPLPVVDMADKPAQKPGLFDSMKAKMGEALKASVAAPVEPVIPKPAAEIALAPPPPPPLPAPPVLAQAAAPAPAPVAPPQPPAMAPPPPPAPSAPANPAVARPVSRNPFDSLEEEMAKLLGRAPDGKG